MRLPFVPRTRQHGLWPDEDPLGRCVVVVAEARECATVVGIAADTKRRALREERAIEVYVPREQRRIGGDPMIIVRAADVSRVVATVRQELLRLDPSILYVHVELPHEEVRAQLRPWRLGASVFVLFGALALVVAAVGLYSVVSYVVAQRRQEIGVRIALGAQSSDITRMVMANVVLLVGAGLVIGLGLSLIGGRGVASLLFETSPTDAVVFATVVVTMGTVAVAAAAFPVLRARRVDPLEALRME